MSKEASILSQEKPEVCPVAAVRVAASQTPNRRNTKLEYHHHGTFKFDEGEVKCLSHKRTGSLLFIMPDGSGYNVETAIVGNQVYKYWKQTSLQASDPTPIDANLEDPQPIELES